MFTNKKIISLSQQFPAFTLIELLATLALITLLIGILIPALSSARATAQRNACASNLQQLMIADLAYAQDHKSRLAPGAANFLQNLDRWHGHRDTVNQPFQPQNSPLSPYLGKNGTIRQCPAFDPDYSQPGDDFEKGSGGYGYNNAYLGTDENQNDTRGARLADITQPQNTIAFTDAAFAQSYPTLRIIEYSFAEPPLQRKNQSYQLDPSIHFRHKNNANIVWADAHINKKPFATTHANIYGVTKQQMTTLKIGYFDPQNKNTLFDLK